MSILIVASNKDIKPWVDEFLSRNKNLDIQIYPNVTNKDNITMVLMWSKSTIDFKQFKNLKCISSMGAGVNHILENKTIPSYIAITKIVDKELVNSMWEYLLCSVMNIVTNQYRYITQQHNCIWEQQNAKSISNYTIGIMGLGQLGKNTAINFEKLGFKIKAYSYSKKTIQNIQCYDINQLDDFKKDVDVIINLMPLTPLNQNIFDFDFFRTLKKDCYFINVGRGEHLVENDLTKALEQNILSGATLDVFRTEPLEKNHPFWKNCKITITPHSASITNVSSVIDQILDNYKRINKNQTILNQIDKNLSY